MKQYTSEQIVEKVREIWADEGYIEKVQARVSQSRDLVVITLSKMYSAPGFSFDKLEALAKFFDTKNIETESEFARGGCESCDYGSEYGFDLYVRRGDSYQS